MSPPPTPALAAHLRLREATRAEHEAIEGAVPLLRPDLDRAAYADHLARLHAWTAPVEARLALVLAGHRLLDAASRARAGLLARDLADLGRATEPPAPESALPPLPGAAEAAGALYVLEGSRLGGQVILRRIGERLGISAEHGARHLAGAGAGTGSGWAAFREALDASLEGEQHVARACTGACATFRSLRLWLSA